MGIILTTINTFFGIINTIFSLINLIFIGGMILAVVYFGPKIKAIFDGFTSLQNINTQLSQQTGGGSVPSCLTQKQIDELKKKITYAKDNIEQFKNLPVIGKLIPATITTTIDEAISNFNNIPLCQ